MAAKIAPVPQKALARVNQSARWKSRSIEKWRWRVIAAPVAGGRHQHAKSAVLVGGSPPESARNGEVRSLQSPGAARRRFDHGVHRQRRAIEMGVDPVQ